MIENEKAIIDSWKQNSSRWIKTIENEDIQSRTEVTNQAIINTILSFQPQSVLDMGCGEGWICRQLNEEGINCLGIDGSPDLIEYAKNKGGEKYLLASYEELIEGSVQVADTFDLIVFNYSLFGKQNTYDILEYAATLLKPKGTILIQTIHPDNELVSDEDTSRWVTEDWKGLDPEYKSYQWYFRTKSDWIKLFGHIDLFLNKDQNVFRAETSSPFSIIFEVKKRG